MTNYRKSVLTLLAVILFAALSCLTVMCVTPGSSAQAENANIALGKPVSSSSGNKDYAVTDGKKTEYWEAEPYPAVFEVDLQAVYDVTSVKLFPYADGRRYYRYSVYTSADGREYLLFAQKTDNYPETDDGTEYTVAEAAAARYIRVEMTYNSANSAVHMREIEVKGVLNQQYTVVLPETDPSDGLNVAYMKKTTSNLPFIDPAKLTDGSLTSFWQAKFCPSYVDVDLGENYLIEEIILFFPDVTRYVNYTVYGSTDGDNFKRIYRKHNSELPAETGDVIEADGAEYRFIRLYAEYTEGRNGVSVSEIKVHGQPTGKNDGALREGSIESVLNVKPFSETEYAAEITEEETVANVYGIVERTVGRLYRDWFDFQIAGKRNGNDWYELSDADGKILIKGSDGVALAAGVNFYFKNYAGVNITEQAGYTLMPKKLVEIGDKPVYRETPYSVRYAFNYCTMDYSFAFYDEEDFQKEYDWLALNGVNVVLDLAGQEAVWVKFLMNFGYSYDAAKAWLCGPAYYAWQFMDNMEIYGGCVTDGWVKERLESARRMQRWRTSLGMQTCLQAYAGMVPNDFGDYVPEAEILEQGTWNGLDRPDMIRTDSELYDRYAELFYAAQEWAFGNNTDYYAADPFHEGGIRPSDLKDDVIAAEVLNSLLEYDADAVWVIQAWHSNPSNDLLKGLGERKNAHSLILDLCGLEAPKWNRTTYGEDGEGGMTIDEIEFNSTPWVWCVLENYGGNPSMDGEMSAMISRLAEARENARYLTGIGVISEATLDNPAMYNMLFDLAWGTFTAEEWTAKYVEARYGGYSENALAAWEILLDTVYTKNNWYRTTPYVVTLTPEWAGIQTLPYQYESIEAALALLLEDFNELCFSEGYRYDVTELMRQMVNDYSVLKYNEVYDAYLKRNLDAFRKAKEEYLRSFDVMDAVLSCRSEWLCGEWIGKAEDWGVALDNDFAYDSLVNNAKTLITTWADQIAMRCIPDYAQRNYQGMLTDLYKPRWEVWLDKLEANLETGAAVVRLTTDDYYHIYMNWVMSDKTYERTPAGIDALWQAAERVFAECSSAEIGIIAKNPDDDLLKQYASRLEDIDRTRYSGRQLEILDGLAGRIAQSSSETLTRTDYFELLEEMEKAYAVMVSPLYDGQTEPVTPGKNNTGWIIGGSIGGAALLGGAAAFAAVRLKKKKRSEESESE